MNNVLREGNIVGFHEGKVSAVTKGCRLVGVVTERAAVVGSKASLGTAAAAAGVTVAYCGRVPITVIGPVKTGAVLIPSGPSTFKPPPQQILRFSARAWPWLRQWAPKHGLRLHFNSCVLRVC